MEIIILEDQRVRNSKVCEFFGLSNSGKSTYVREVIKKGYCSCVPYDKEYIRKLG